MGEESEAKRSDHVDNVGSSAGSAERGQESEAKRSDHVDNVLSLIHI